MGAVSSESLVGIDALGKRQAWLSAAACLAVIFVAIVAMFWDAVAGAVRVWSGSETFNHGFLIAPIVAYLVWGRRVVFSAMSPRPTPWLLALLPGAVLAWLAGDIAAIQELQQFAVIAMLQVVAASVVGIAAYRALLFPCLYLFLLVPSGEWLTAPLQDVTTWFVVQGLELLSVPVYADGVFIDVPNGRFEVAEACAGLRFLIASIAFGLLFANLVYRSAGRRIVFVGLSLVVPVIANGLRALGIVYIAYLTDNQVAVGIDHIVYGWGFFTAILLGLIWIGLRFREDQHLPAQELRMPISEQPLSKPKLGAAGVALIAIAILGLGPAYAGYVRAQGSSEVNMTLQEPDARPPWRQVPWISSWRPVYVGATAQTSLAYSDTTATVELFVAAYADQGPSRELIGFANRLEDGEVWRRVSDGVDSLTLDGSERPALLRRLDGREGTRFLWRIYWVDGHWTASATAARLRYVLRKLTRGQSTSAVLVLSSSARSEAVARAAVQRFLRSLSNIPAMLR